MIKTILAICLWFSSQQHQILNVTTHNLYKIDNPCTQYPPEWFSVPHPRVAITDEWCEGNVEPTIIAQQNGADLILYADHTKDVGLGQNVWFSEELSKVNQNNILIPALLIGYEDFEQLSTEYLSTDNLSVKHKR